MHIYLLCKTFLSKSYRALPNGFCISPYERSFCNTDLTAATLVSSPTTINIQILINGWIDRWKRQIKHLQWSVVQSVIEANW
jgi:hypothetical protein